MSIVYSVERFKVRSALRSEEYEVSQSRFVVLSVDLWTYAPDSIKTLTSVEDAVALRYRASLPC